MHSSHEYNHFEHFLGSGALFGWGIHDFLGGVFAKQIGPFKSFFWSQLASLLSVFLLAFVFTINFNVSILVIILSAIVAIIYAAGYLFFFKGFEIGDVSIVAATMNLWAVFTMCLYLYGTTTFYNTICRSLDDNLRRNAGILKLE